MSPLRDRRVWIARPRGCAGRADRLTVGARGRRHVGDRRHGDRAGSRAAGEAPASGPRPRRVRHEGPEQPRLEAAGRATQDTVAVLVEGYEATSRQETVLFNMLTGFVGAFALIRLSTAGIRGGWWPAGNVRLGGRHIHHFVPGILIAFGSGRAGAGHRRVRARAALAVPFGAGIGLTFDEAALLLDLRDVYWTREGILSVQLSLGLAATLGGTDPGPADAPPRRGAGRGGGPDPGCLRPCLAEHAIAGEELAARPPGARPARGVAPARGGRRRGPARRRPRALGRG